MTALGGITVNIDIMICWTYRRWKWKLQQHVQYTTVNTGETEVYSIQNVIWFVSLSSRKLYRAIIIKSYFRITENIKA